MKHRSPAPATATIGRVSHDPGRPGPATTHPTSRVRLTGLARLAAWVALLAGAHLALGRAGALLPVPAPGTEVLEWLHRSDPVLAAFSVLRLVALAITWYLTVVTGLLLLARLSRITALLRVADRVTLPVVRRLVHHIVGTGLAVAIAGGTVPLLTGSGAVALAEPPPPVVTMHLVDETPPATATAPGPETARPAEPAPRPAAPPEPERPPAPAPVPEVRMVQIDDDAPAAPEAPEGLPTAGRGATVPADQDGEIDRAGAGAPPSERPATAAPPEPAATPEAPTSTSTTPPTMQVTPDGPAPDTPPPPAEGPTAGAPGGAAGDAPPTVEAGPPAPDATDPGIWTVQPGDHFWHIAEVTVRQARGAAATDDTIAVYWGALIAANRERLVVPGVADLIIPGQQFVLPPVAPSASAA